METEIDFTGLAERLHDARRGAKEIGKITQNYPDLTLSQAYRVQWEGIALRRADGERQIGMKMGLTSESKRRQMGLDQPVFGVLTDRMRIEDDFKIAGSIHPKAEPEIAFLFEKELKGRLGREEILKECSGVAPAVEVLDSRYIGFKYFSLPDVVADNSSSFRFKVGEWAREFGDLDLAGLKMRFTVNGQLAHEAQSSAISGDPVLSVVELLALLSDQGLSLPAGSLVLAGAATPAVSLEQGMEIELDIAGLAPLNLRVS